MSVLVLHPEQTHKQPVFWFCYNPECRNLNGSIFEFESDYPRCPKCTCEGHPVIQKKALIHLLISDPKGPIPGSYGRYRLACDKSREHLATPKNGEAATDQYSAANCPGCLTAVQPTSGLTLATQGPYFSMGR